MCHQTTYTHSCTHKIQTPRLLCSLASLPTIFHSLTKAKVPLLYPCPSCSARLGQPITYPYQVPLAAPVPAPAQVIYQTAPGVVVPPPPAHPVQQVPGPGSYGTPLPVPSNATTDTRLEYIQGAWRPVVHYRFPSTTAPPPVPVNRPANMPANQGWSQVHGVDPGPGPPGPQPSGNGGASSGVPVGDNGNFGWGPQASQPQPQNPAQTAQSSSLSSSTSAPLPPPPPTPSQQHPPPQAASSTSNSAPAEGPPPNVLAAAAVQAPLPAQTPSSQPRPRAQGSSTQAQQPSAQQTNNQAARNLGTGSLLGMSSSMLGRVTAANTNANANNHGHRRPASS